MPAFFRAFPFLTALLLGANATSAPAPMASGSPREVLLAYLGALEALDQEGMNRFLADEVTTRSPDGRERTMDREYLRRMREFERAVETSWTHRILKVSGDRVTVELVEKNDFYDLLGVGDRSSVREYRVRRGRIDRMEVLQERHEDGGDYAATYERFKRWLSATPAGSDPRLMRDGRVLFNGESAPLMRPWLERWAAEGFGRRSAP